MSDLTLVGASGLADWRQALPASPEHVIKGFEGSIPGLGFLEGYVAARLW